LRRARQVIPAIVAPSSREVLLDPCNRIIVTFPFNGAGDGSQVMTRGLAAGKVSPALRGFVKTSKPAVWAKTLETVARARKSEENCILSRLQTGTRF
jgi:hypothetical protein